MKYLLILLAFISINSFANKGDTVVHNGTLYVNTGDTYEVLIPTVETAECFTRCYTAADKERDNAIFWTLMCVLFFPTMGFIIFVLIDIGETPFHPFNIHS